MPRYIAICRDCSETRILDEWGRCKACAWAWWKGAMSRELPDKPTPMTPPMPIKTFDDRLWLTNTDEWFIIAATQKELNEAVRNMLKTKNLPPKPS